jgi:hypothetical protein
VAKVSAEKNKSTEVNIAYKDISAQYRKAIYISQGQLDKSY